MPHIHTDIGQHDLTTTAFIIRMDGDVPRMLFHRHRKLLKLLPVGGHVELHEHPWHAVLHEIIEESGYEPSQLRVMQPTERIRPMKGLTIHPTPLSLQTHEYAKDTAHYHTDIEFLFITDQLPLRKPKAGESDEIIWLSEEEMAVRASDMPADVAGIASFCFQTALVKWEPVALDTYDD